MRTFTLVLLNEFFAFLTISIVLPGAFPPERFMGHAPGAVDWFMSSMLFLLMSASWPVWLIVYPIPLALWTIDYGWDWSIWTEHWPWSYFA